jgi:uncharacterized damage-inducible protein DinB
VLDHAWATTLERAAALPDGAVEDPVDGEWSFAQTLRHLVHATDAWLGRAILRRDEPFHRLGLTGGVDDDVVRAALDPTAVPSYDEVLAARADRVDQVREFLAAVPPDELAAARRNPWDPDHEETVLSCLHVILEEEWEHLRYAVRDLETIAARSDA